jgi:hypothetical protein
MGRGLGPGFLKLQVCGENLLRCGHFLFVACCLNNANLVMLICLSAFKRL